MSKKNVKSQKHYLKNNTECFIYESIEYCIYMSCLSVATSDSIFHSSNIKIIHAHIWTHNTKCRYA